MVASRGRAERIIEEERFGGIEEGDSSGILSVIAASCLLRNDRAPSKTGRNWILIATDEDRPRVPINFVPFALQTFCFVRPEAE